MDSPRFNIRDAFHISVPPPPLPAVRFAAMQPVCETQLDGAAGHWDVAWPWDKTTQWRESAATSCDNMTLCDVRTTRGTMMPYDALSPCDVMTPWDANAQTGNSIRFEWLSSQRGALEDKLLPGDVLQILRNYEISKKVPPRSVCLCSVEIFFSQSIFI